MIPIYFVQIDFQITEIKFVIYAFLYIDWPFYKSPYKKKAWSSCLYKMPN